ncbi:MAG: DUF6691 family protein [Pseudomonadota bacterium]
MKALAAALAGVVFGVGLTVSGMVDPRNVLAFLTLDAAWNPALILVMGSALAVAALGYRWVLRRAHPLFADGFTIPARRDIDPALLGGAALFGVGWGLSGYCPGPALVGAFFVDARALVFLCACLIGGAAHDLGSAVFARRARLVEADG